MGFASLWQLGSIVLTTQAHKTAKVTHANTVLSVIGRPTKTVATSTNCLCDLCKQTESRITNKTILKPSRPLPHENNLTNQLPFHASKTNDNQLANSSVTPYLLFSALQILSALSKKKCPCLVPRHCSDSRESWTWLESHLSDSTPSQKQERPSFQKSTLCLLLLTQWLLSVVLNGRGFVHYLTLWPYTYRHNPNCNLALRY